MSGKFFAVGKLEPSNTGHSFKVFLLDPEGKWFLVGLVTPRALAMLLRREVPQADICRFSSSDVQEPLNFSLELKP
jgi:hypothetical protein